MMIEKIPATSTHIKLGMPSKVIYTVLAVVCVVIGLIGLVIPIIPGILFIGGAIFLLSKVSSRVHDWSERQTWLHDARVRMIQMGSLRPLSKARFLCLLAAKSVVSGVQTALRFFGSLIPKR